jgi:hypothetical protein
MPVLISYRSAELHMFRRLYEGLTRRTTSNDGHPQGSSIPVTALHQDARVKDGIGLKVHGGQEEVTDCLWIPLVYRLPVSPEGVVHSDSSIVNLDLINDFLFQLRHGQLRKISGLTAMLCITNPRIYLFPD